MVPCMADERGVLIHLFGEPPVIDGAPEEAPRKGFCWPHAPSVDKVSRLVTCKRCKSQLDPVDVLLQVADHYDDYVRLGKETSTMRTQLVELRAEEKRIKARMQSHSRKDADVAVSAERERWLESLRRIGGHTDEIARAARLIAKVIGKR